MKNLKGFIFEKDYSGKLDFLLNKINLEGTFSGIVSLKQCLNNFGASKEDFFFANINGVTLCLSDTLSPERLTYLSVFGTLVFFELDLKKGMLTSSILADGEVGKDIKEALNIKSKKSILSSIFNFNSNKNHHHTLFKAINILAQSINIDSTVAYFSYTNDIIGISKYRTSPPRTTYVDPFTKSSNATPFSVNLEKIKRLMPSAVDDDMPYKTDFDGSPMTEEKYATRIKETIRAGVVSPALLLQHNPLCISVYSFDMDAVVFLKFEEETDVAKKYKLYPVGAKLVAVNTYFTQAQSGLTDGVEIDIIPGPKSSGLWKSFAPIIVNFVASNEDYPLIRYWEKKFDYMLWQRVKRLSTEYAKRFPGEARYGYFMFARLVTRDFSEKFFPHLHKDS